MSFSPLLPLLLVAGWISPAVIIALLYVINRIYPWPETYACQSMKQSLKSVRAEIDQLDLGPQTDAWRRETWRGPDERMRDRISDSSREVLVLTPYAEVLIPVEKADERELRRCSICLN